MPSLILDLNKIEQKILLKDLDYLNMAEIKNFCRRHTIPYTIWVEAGKKDRRKTQDEDRKGIILNRIRNYLKTGNILKPTCFPSRVVCFENLAKRLKETDRLYYGQYDKKSDAMILLLKRLTNGQFKDGAVARICAKEFWTEGMAPTYREYATAWLKAKKNHRRPNPEWAFLSDRADRKAMKDWKQLRIKKAKQVLRILNRLQPKQKTGLTLHASKRANVHRHAQKRYAP